MIKTYYKITYYDPYFRKRHFIKCHWIDSKMWASYEEAAKFLPLVEADGKLDVRIEPYDRDVPAYLA